MVTRYTFVGVQTVSNRRYKENGNILYAVQTKSKRAGRVMVCVFVLFGKQYAFFPSSAARKIGMDRYVTLSVGQLFCYTWNARIFIYLGSHRVGTGYRNRFSESLRVGRSRIGSPWGREFLHPSRPALGPPSLLYSGYRISFPRLTRPGRGVNHLPPYSEEVKGRVALYL
jgi:hypothetical protein